MKKLNLLLASTLFSATYSAFTHDTYGNKNNVSDLEISGYTNQLFELVENDPYNLKEMKSLVLLGAQVNPRFISKKPILHYLADGVRTYKDQVSGNAPDFFPIKCVEFLLQNGATLQSVTIGGCNFENEETYLPFKDYLEKLYAEAIDPILKKKYKEGLDFLRTWMDNRKEEERKSLEEKYYS